MYHYPGNCSQVHSGLSVAAPLSTRQGVHGAKRTKPVHSAITVQMPSTWNSLCEWLQVYTRGGMGPCRRFALELPMLETSPAWTLSYLSFEYIVLNSLTKLIPGALYLCSASCRAKLLNTRELESVWI